MKKAFWILLIALLSTSVCVFSQTAKEVMEKVFANVEKNYDLSEHYSKYEIKMSCFKGDELKSAFEQDIVLKYPERVNDKTEIISSSSKSYPSKRLRVTYLQPNTVYGMYSSYIKNKDEYFDQYKDMDINSTSDGHYLVNLYTDNGQQTLKVKKSDYAVTESTFIYTEENKNAKTFLLFPTSEKRETTTIHCLYAQSDLKYTLDKYECKITKNKLHRKKGEYNVISNLIVKHICYNRCKDETLNKNDKQEITYEEALNLVKNM